MAAVNFGALADKLYAKNAEIAAQNAVLKDLENQKRDVENELLGAMKAAGTNIVRGNMATVSISEVTRPSIGDFDAFSNFVLRHKATHLFERRISATAYREQKDLLGGKPIPGVTEFTQDRLNVRKV